MDDDDLEGLLERPLDWCEKCNDGKEKRVFNVPWIKSPVRGRWICGPCIQREEGWNTGPGIDSLIEAS